MKYETKRKLLHLFFPTRCPICGSIIYYMDRFCEECDKKLKIYDGDFTIPDTAGFFASFLYDENSMPAIILLKRGICGNADYALGCALADKLKETGTDKLIDIIIPIPMYSADKRKRSYNQAELIAKVVSQNINKTCCTDALIKTRRTEQQKTLGKEMRAVNLENAFSLADPEAINGKTVVLIDDICTTGSTLSAAVKVLLEAEPKAIYCAVCCKTPHKAAEEESPEKDELM